MGTQVFGIWILILGSCRQSPTTPTFPASHTLRLCLLAGNSQRGMGTTSQVGILRLGKTLNCWSSCLTLVSVPLRHFVPVAQLPREGGRWECWGSMAVSHLILYVSSPSCSWEEQGQELEIVIVLFPGGGEGHQLPGTLMPPALRLVPPEPLTSSSGHFIPGACPPLCQASMGGQNAAISISSLISLSPLSPKKQAEPRHALSKLDF